MSQVRTRFAPSPTGYFHLGGARTALFSWLYARQHDGVFLLRIEDTDKERSTPENTQLILDSMAWLKLEPDEPTVFQSANLADHTAKAESLLESGQAYRCYATTDEIQVARATAKAAGNPSWKYKAPDCVISADEQARRAAEGEPSVVRFKVPRDGGMVEFADLVYGEQSIDPNEIDDFVLLRTDGSPLYMLSVVCDDIAMRVTHVIRGQDHLSNTPKQILLYQALGAEVPIFAHLPLIMAPGGQKLSKRKHGDVVSIATYRERGFLPDGVINFLALLGWGPGEGETQEIFTREELIERFELARVGRSNAQFTFDEQNPLKWTDPKAQSINAEWIRTRPIEELLPEVQPLLEAAGLWDEGLAGERAEWFKTTLDLIRQRFWTLLDFVEQGAAYYSDTFPFDEKAVSKNLCRDERLVELLPALGDRLADVEPFTAEGVEEVIRALAEAEDVKSGLLINGLRTAVTGQSVGPGAFVLCETIGRERVVQRLRSAPDVIRGAG